MSADLRARLLDRARSSVRALSMGVFTLGMVGAEALHERSVAPAAGQALFQRWMQIWARGLMQVFGMQVALVNPPPSAANRARLVVANHRSPIDILLLLEHFGGIVLSRADVARWPVLGLAARRAQTIFVDREDTQSGIGAIRAIRERLQRGQTVIVFPEGMTSGGDVVKPFRGGAFIATRGLDVEVVCVGVAYEAGTEFLEESFVAHMQRVAARKTTHLACAFGTPRKLEGSHKQLTTTLRDEVQALVTAARQRLNVTLGTPNPTQTSNLEPHPDMHVDPERATR